MTDMELFNQPYSTPEGANLEDLPNVLKAREPRALEAQPLIDASHRRDTEPASTIVGAATKSGEHPAEAEEEVATPHADAPQSADASGDSSAEYRVEPGVSGPRGDTPSGDHDEQSDDIVQSEARGASLTPKKVEEEGEVAQERAEGRPTTVGINAAATPDVDEELVAPGATRSSTQMVDVRIRADEITQSQDLGVEGAHEREDEPPNTADNLRNPVRRSVRARRVPAKLRDNAEPTAAARSSKSRKRVRFDDCTRVVEDERHEARAVHQTEYVIDKIVDHGMCNDAEQPTAKVGERLYRARWYGFGASADTWEPTRHIPRNKIPSYLKRNQPHTPDDVGQAQDG